MSNPNPHELPSNKVFFGVIGIMVLIFLLMKWCPVLDQLIMGY